MTSPREDTSIELLDPEVLLLLLDDPKLSRLLARLQVSPDKPLTLNEAAAICMLHPTTFSTRFRKITGITFSDWYRAFRIERGKRLLARKGFTVLRVALAVGYRDAGTFTRAFKKCMGITPSVYARQASSAASRGASRASEADRVMTTVLAKDARKRRFR